MKNTIFVDDENILLVAHHGDKHENDHDEDHNDDYDDCNIPNSTVE